MPQPQSAICAETGAFGLFLTLTLASDAPAPALRRALAAIPALTHSVANRMAEPTLVSSVAIGSAVWQRLMETDAPAGLVPFQALFNAGRFYLKHFALARRIMTELGPMVRLVEEIHGFKHLGGRDLTGFVDGTENAKGAERAGVALVADGPFAGGSFVSLQRYVHQLSRWETLAVPEQEAVFGRTKEADEEMDDEVKPPTAHIARVVIEEDGTELEILRHSLPYGTTTEAGLYFVAYGASPHPFRTMLERMVLQDSEGHYDHLMNFSQPVTGAAFFAPSLDRLTALE